MNSISPYQLSNTPKSGIQEVAFTQEPITKKPLIELPIGWKLPLALAATGIILVVMVGLGFGITRLIGK